MKCIYCVIRGVLQIKKLLYFILGVTSADAPLLNPLMVPPNIAIGDNTVILCTTKRGNPPLQFSQLHNGKEVDKYSKYKISSMHTSSHISIDSIETSDIGNFTCVARNAFGEDRKTESVFMEGKENFHNKSNLHDVSYIVI